MGRPQGGTTDVHPDRSDRAAPDPRPARRLRHDFDRALRFYRDTLGFEVAYTYGEPPFWGEVDAKALFLRYQSAGVDFYERLRRTPWNHVEFIVRDPDGNLILFGSPV